MAQSEMHLKYDGQQLLDAVSELKLYIDSLPSNSRERLIQFLFVGDKLSHELIYIETLPASGMWTCVILLKPSNLFLDLLSALRAGNLDDFLVKAECHLTSSDIVTANTSVHRKETL